MASNRARAPTIVSGRTRVDAATCVLLALDRQHRVHAPVVLGRARTNDEFLFPRRIGHLQTPLNGWGRTNPRQGAVINPTFLLFSLLAIPTVVREQDDLPAKSDGCQPFRESALDNQQSRFMRAPVELFTGGPYERLCWPLPPSPTPRELEARASPN